MLVFFLSSFLMALSYFYFANLAQSRALQVLVAKPGKAPDSCTKIWQPSAFSYFTPLEWL
jgi:hypothetical protein